MKICPNCNETFEKGNFCKYCGGSLIEQNLKNCESLYAVKAEKQPFRKVLIEIINNRFESLFVWGDVSSRDYFPSDLPIRKESLIVSKSISIETKEFVILSNFPPPPPTIFDILFPSLSLLNGKTIIYNYYIAFGTYGFCFAKENEYKKYVKYSSIKNIEIKELAILLTLKNADTFTLSEKTINTSEFRKLLGEILDLINSPEYKIDLTNLDFENIEDYDTDVLIEAEKITNSPFLQCELGKRNLRDYNPPNLDIAFEYAKKAVNQDYPRGYRQLGNLYSTRYLKEFREKNDKLAYKNFYSGATKGDVESQYQLAICYFEGLGIEGNLQQAKYWAEKAVENGREDTLDILK